MINLKKIFIIVALFTIQQSAHSATYYIDANLGNDSWSGNFPSPSSAPAADGPWLTLAKVATAKLLPGDTVLLRCGQTWYETLRLSASGSVSQPIRIGSYPAPCNNRPLIDGSATVPKSAWSLDTDGSYRSKFPANLVTNGEFDKGTTGWYRWSSDDSVSLGIDNTNCISGAAPCISVLGGASSTRNWIASTHHIAVEAGKTHQLTLGIRVPLGKTVLVKMRRGSPPWDTVDNAVAPITGNNAWQTVNLSFRPRQSLQDLRVDIEGTGSANFYVDNVSVVPAVGTPLGLYIGNTAHVTAHHPNRGHDSNEPESPYIVMASDSNSVSNTTAGSSYIPLHPDPAVPSATRLMAPGVSVFVRSAPWMLERKTITSVQQDKILLDSPTKYRLRAGYGYFLTGARWMLDDPGEWLYDTGSRAIHLRTSDMAAPGSRVSVIHLQKGVDLSGRADIELRGVAIRRTGIGVDLSRSTGVAVVDCQITDTANEGLLPAATTNALIEKNHIANTGLDAVRGLKDGFAVASGLRVFNNRIENSAVLIQNGRILSLPVSAVAAISSGQGASIEGNHVRNAAYHGITSWHAAPSGNSTIRRNHIENACSILDDCGGIYVSRQDNNNRIEDNIIRNMRGNSHGRPGGRTHVVGIYLDERSSGATVSGNTVENVDYGIQLHNAEKNYIDANTLFGNRSYQLWLHEDSAAGDISGNSITNNLIFPTGSALGIVQDTSFASTSLFASYDFNRHSALISRHIARERSRSGESRYDFMEWQRAKDNGISRNLDPNGRHIVHAGYSAFQVQGTSLIAPINIADDMSGWRAWNNASPRAVISVDECGALPCVKLIAGASRSVLSTPNFSVEANRWYRLTFDMKTKFDGQKVTVSPRRGGGGANGFELFTKAITTVHGTLGWKRRTILIEATLTIQKNDPVTGDAGARIDFENIMPDEEIAVANVEMVPLRQVATLRAALLSNATTEEAEVPCPDEDAAPAACNHYVSFTRDATISWPHRLAPHSSEIVYALAGALVDSDGDDIADTQDQCPETPQASVANSLGCPFPLGF
ncbi:right-handed parallel beta-helix repeat-containing protein [Nitrosospira briensis]|uniref:right-handed parallel beta-helix repeat-containing protein n=1 Tax=Nitrosospira briensis TaxID=35799 RepID=UPI0008E580B7|nr:right-handed parallel beta-helix repeat-containing protein [Nitrosospira briensis]SFO30333.1 parallel beta-helix repeat (two copies) [Nitrosospira briensis]